MVGKHSRVRDVAYWTTQVPRARRIALMISILWGSARSGLADDVMLLAGAPAANPAVAVEAGATAWQQSLLLAATGMADGDQPATPALPLLRLQNLPGAAGLGRRDSRSKELLPSVDASEGGTQAPTGTATRSPATSVRTSRELDDDDGETSWRVPPIRWGGSLGYSFMRSSSSGGASSTSHAFQGTLNTASYIYAPWAATVSSRIGLATSSSSSGGLQGNSGFGAPDQSRNSSVVGGTEVNVFPSSRFPFQAFFDRSDSRMSGNLVRNDYVSNRFGFRQNYRAVDGITHAGLQFDRSSVKSSLGGDDTLTAISGHYGTNIGIVRNSINGRYSLGERNQSGERAKLFGLNTTHTASFDDNLNISGNINYLDNTLQGRSSAGGFGDYQSRYLQLNGFATWMPEFEEREDFPLTLNLGARFMNLKSTFSGNASDSQGMGANLNALYRYSRNFTLGSSFAINNIRSSNQEGILLTQIAANANYVGDPLIFGKYSYNWNAGSGIVRLGSNGAISATTTTTLQAGHAVSRNFEIGQNQTLMLSASQSISSNHSQETQRSDSLSHSLAASYGIRWAERYSGMASLSISDITTRGTNASRYRMLGASLNGTGQLSPVSSVNMNLQFNWSQSRIDARQNLEFSPDGGFDTRQSMGVFGSASYTHNRFMGLRGLRYNLLFTADTRMRDDRLLGNINGEIERTRWTINNRLDYRIALLDFRVNGILNDTGGKKNALLFFQVTRQIGAY